VAAAVALALAAVLDANVQKDLVLCKLNNDLFQSVRTILANSVYV